MWNYGSNSASHPMMWMGMAFGFIVLLIFLALAIWMIVAFSRRNAAKSRVPPSSRAIELLKERYAVEKSVRKNSGSGCWSLQGINVISTAAFSERSRMRWQKQKAYGFHFS